MNLSKVKTTLQDLWQITSTLGVEYIKGFLCKNMQNFLEVDQAVIYIDREEIGGFQFDIIESQEISMGAEVTDHYIDTNRAIQDHIVTKPLEVVFKGMIGRYKNDISLNDKQSHSISYYQVMNLVSSYIPKMPGVNVARKIKQKISNLTSNSILNRLVNSATSFAFGIGKEIFHTLWEKAVKKFNLSPIEFVNESTVQIKSPEAKAVKELQALFMAQELVDVCTAWTWYKNMLITELKITKDNGDITEFTIRLKQINTVESLVTSNNNSANAKERTGNQLTPVDNLGTTQGEKVDNPYSKPDDVPTENIRYWW